MMKPLELIQVGDEIGIIFPEELCASLQVELGNDVYLTPTARGFSLHSTQNDVGVFFEKTTISARQPQG